MAYFAHSDSTRPNSKWHRLQNHLEDTAELTGQFASSFGAEKLGYLAGLLHDIGKYSPEFQKRLEGDKNRVDHSTAGAVEAYGFHKVFGVLLSYVVAGHHSGLQDWGSREDESSLEGRLNKLHLPDYSAYRSEIILPNLLDVSFPIKKVPSGLGFSAQFFIRFLYSSLVDADFLDTEGALNMEKASLRGAEGCVVAMLEEFEQFMADKQSRVADTLVNQERAKVLTACRKKAELPPGLFTLTVPTGGGKTLSSLAFALRHAVAHEQERIIYVIPYTSIIEQNAAVFRSIFGPESVLEHHSNFSAPEDNGRKAEAEDDIEIWAKLKLASENWDVPLVATTNVQFFESLFAAKSSRCRKLHNLANSVVIIDEAQMIPTGFLKPCLNALVELVSNYHVTVVLCTATPPAIKNLLPKGVDLVEIVPDPEQLYQVLRRTAVKSLGPLEDEDLVARLQEQDQVLCILNSKKHARIVYEKIRGDDAFHLSTRMCPVHRSETLAIIRLRLERGDPCRVVSTQLIEAGVDIDFPVVYRSSAGIDSIAQSAGRCNREGRRESGEVYVFKPEKHGMPAGWLSRTAEIGESVLRRYADPLGLEAVKAYFSELYDIEGEALDKKHILDEIAEQERQLRFPFRSIADKFQLIDDSTRAIVIPWNEDCETIIEQARWHPHPGKLMRKLQKYTVQVYEQEFREMLKFGMLENVAGSFHVMRPDRFTMNYCPNTGLLPVTESMLLKDTLII